MKIIDQEVFANEILQDTTSMLYVVDFFADWCGPCKMLTPILDQLQAQYEGQIMVVKIDIDSNQELTDELHITSIPTVLIYRAGQKIETIISLKPQEFWSPLIDGLLTA